MIQVNSIRIGNLIKLFSILLSLLFVTGCFKHESTTSQSEASEKTIAIPSFVKANLIPASCGLQAWIIIDSNSPIAMTVSGQTASYTAEKISIGPHEFTIQFKCATPDILLAQANISQEILGGENVVDFSDDKLYLPLPDFDDDNVSNLREVALNSDPKIWSPPSKPSLAVNGSSQSLQFSWGSDEFASTYRLLVNIDGNSGFVEVKSGITQTVYNHKFAAYKADQASALYVLEACNNKGCGAVSDTVSIDQLLLANLYYIKASNTLPSLLFGKKLVLSSDGNTLAISSTKESSAATGVNGNQNDDCAAATPMNCARTSGAIYVYRRDPTGDWQSAPDYIKASNTSTADSFGVSLGISQDGNTLAVAAPGEDSAAPGINGNQVNDCARAVPINCAGGSGAIYIYSRDESGNWGATPVYLKSSDPSFIKGFGSEISLSQDGNVLAVAASGGVYVYSRDVEANWGSAPVYFQAPINFFGNSVSLNQDGSTIAIAAFNDSSAARGVNGDSVADCTAATPTNCAANSGAVYVYRQDTLGNWLLSNPDYIKASNTLAGDFFGGIVSLSGDGNTLAVGAKSEDSAGIGVNGSQFSDCGFTSPSRCVKSSGAVYVYYRDTFGNWGATPIYFKASNTILRGNFGHSVQLSQDGKTLAVGAYAEGGAAEGINGDQVYDCDSNNFINCKSYSGAAYIYNQDAFGNWLAKPAYIKASNTMMRASFGDSIGLSQDGNTLAIGSSRESSAARGVNGNQIHNCSLTKLVNCADESGAVYVY